MDIAGRVSWISKNANGDWYIIGASDKENKAFAKRMRENTFHIDKEELKKSVDLIEIGAVKRIDNVDESYLESKITGMPHCFGDSYGDKVRGEIQTAVSEYCDGKMSDEDIKQTLIDACKDMRVYHAQSWHTIGENVEDNTQIIEQVYELFQKTNVRNMVGKCFEDGNEIADEWGGREKTGYITIRNTMEKRSICGKCCRKHQGKSRPSGASVRLILKRWNRRANTRWTATSILTACGIGGRTREGFAA